jgi:hypothetical protein
LPLLPPISCGINRNNSAPNPFSHWANHPIAAAAVTVIVKLTWQGWVIFNRPADYGVGGAYVTDVKGV